MLFYILYTTSKCYKTFFLQFIQCYGYISHTLDQTITEILSIFTKITYLWLTKKAAAIYF